jgi:hypothetical protein
MMKLVYTALLFSGFAIKAQTALQARINIKIDTLSIDHYNPEPVPDPEFRKLYMEVGFGDFTLVDPKEIDVLSNAVIKSVDLVYTKYPKDQDLTELNRRRIEYLHLLCPSIFNNCVTQWRIISQTNCTSEAGARKLYHGFVVIYKPAPTKESMTREYTDLKALWKSKRYVGDSSVVKIFKRNKWKNITVATDLTGSMSPYLSQVFLWYKLTFATKDFSEFIFFNDGNNCSDAGKKTGKTGGIYYCKSKNKDSVFNMAARCMHSGYGGDIQENNIEAILFAIKANPKLKEIIMIADNWAPMRDYVLMSQIKIPVHIIICGKPADMPINTEYLDLARHTKGSIHTVEEDIDELATLAEGKTIEIEGYEYKVVGGRFVKSRKV